MPKRAADDLAFPPKKLKGTGAIRAFARRERNAGACLGSAKEALGELETGGHVFGLNKGQFSMIDLALAVLDQIGPCDVTVWTWVVADYELEAVDALLARREIRSFRLIVDRSCIGSRPGLIADIVRRFGEQSVRATLNHAKIVTMQNERWAVAVRGSMNFNNNPRFEQFDITEGAGIVTFLDEVAGEIFSTAPSLVNAVNSYADVAGHFSRVACPADQAAAGWAGLGIGQLKGL